MLDTGFNPRSINFFMLIRCQKKMVRPNIFLSHITEESTIASIFKRSIDSNFLGLVDVFQSSDPKVQKVGQNWLNLITDNLQNCQAIFFVAHSASRGLGSILNAEQDGDEKSKLYLFVTPACDRYNFLYQ